MPGHESGLRRAYRTKVRFDLRNEFGRKRGSPRAVVGRIRELLMSAVEHAVEQNDNELAMHLAHRALKLQFVADVDRSDPAETLDPVQNRIVTIRLFVVRIGQQD